MSLESTKCKTIEILLVKQPIPSSETNKKFPDIRAISGPVNFRSNRSSAGTAKYVWVSDIGICLCTLSQKVLLKSDRSFTAMIYKHLSEKVGELFDRATKYGCDNLSPASIEGCFKFSTDKLIQWVTHEERLFNRNNWSFAMFPMLFAIYYPLHLCNLFRSEFLTFTLRASCIYNLILNLRRFLYDFRGAVFHGDDG